VIRRKKKTRRDKETTGLYRLGDNRNVERGRQQGVRRRREQGSRDNDTEGRERSGDKRHVE
jgi:hypothetical protein